MKSSDTPLNLLLSFAYGGKGKRIASDFFSLAKDGFANVIIDSGAFTAFNNKGYEFVTLDNYCKFLDVYAEYAQKYVMLDVIGNDAATKRNYETMIRRGYSPMFVATMFDKDWDYMRYAVGNNPHICVAGGATVKNDWTVQRFQRVLKATDGKARIHGLAYVTFPKMMQLGLESVDSSTWIQASQTYGTVGVFYPNGLKQLDKKTFISRLKHGDETVRRVVDECGITKRHLLAPGWDRGQASVSTYLSLAGCLKLQRYVYRRGLRLFFAVGNAQQLRCIRYMAEHKEPRYEDFANFVKSK